MHDLGLHTVFLFTIAIHCCPAKITLRCFFLNKQHIKCKVQKPAYRVLSLTPKTKRTRFSRFKFGVNLTNKMWVMCHYTIKFVFESTWLVYYWSNWWSKLNFEKYAHLLFGVGGSSILQDGPWNWMEIIYHSWSFFRDDSYVLLLLCMALTSTTGSFLGLFCQVCNDYCNIWQLNWKIVTTQSSPVRIWSNCSPLLGVCMSTYAIIVSIA